MKKVLSLVLISISFLILVGCNSKNTINNSNKTNQNEITEDTNKNSTNKEDNDKKIEIANKDGYEKYKNGSIKNKLINIQGNVQLITDVSINSTTKLYMLYVKDASGEVYMYLIENYSLNEDAYKNKNITIDGLVLGTKELDYYPISITSINIK